MFGNLLERHELQYVIMFVTKIYYSKRQKAKTSRERRLTGVKTDEAFQEFSPKQSYRRHV